MPIESNAKTADDVIAELRVGRYANVPERAGRAQDAADGGGLETLRRDGYM
jgi:sulfate adenylyltransferase subunit 2